MDQCGEVDCQRKLTRLSISSFMMQGRHFISSTLVLLKGPISSCTVRWMYTYILHICVMLNVKIERPIELRFDSILYFASLQNLNTNFPLEHCANVVEFEIRNQAA